MFTRFIARRFCNVTRNASLYHPVTRRFCFKVESDEESFLDDIFPQVKDVLPSTDDFKESKQEKKADKVITGNTKKEMGTINGTEKELNIREKFIRGWGKGGQKVNKTSNAVFLQDVQTGLTVKCQQTRYLEQNRKIARKILQEKITEHEKKELSKRQKKVLKIQKRKSKQKKRSAVKYADQVRMDKTQQ